MQAKLASSPRGKGIASYQLSSNFFSSLPIQRCASLDVRELARYGATSTVGQPNHLLYAAVSMLTLAGCKPLASMTAPNWMSPISWPPS